MTIDAETRDLMDVTDGGAISVLGGATPEGLRGYRSKRTGRFYFFATDADGCGARSGASPALFHSASRKIICRFYIEAATYKSPSIVASR